MAVRQNLLMRVCVKCLEKVDMSYLAIYGCTINGMAYYCDRCSHFLRCPNRLVNPEKDKRTTGYCKNCVAKLRKSA